MAGAMRRMAEYLGLVEESYEVDGYEEERPLERSAERPAERYRAPERMVSPVAETRSMRPVPEPSVPARAAALAVSERPAAPARSLSHPLPSSDVYRITTLHPGSYSDARRVGEEFREGVPVIVNLTGMEDADAKRIVDFAAGLIFGLRGTIERVTNKVFLLSPANVDVGAAARAQIAQDGFFNQS
ncbi:MAG: cell division protein SepF [Candidatus Nanopelagicales bacterium]